MTFSMTGDPGSRCWPSCMAQTPRRSWCIRGAQASGPGSQTTLQLRLVGHKALRPPTVALSQPNSPSRRSQRLHHLGWQKPSSETSRNIFQPWLLPKCWEIKAGMLSGLRHPYNPVTWNHGPTQDSLWLFKAVYAQLLQGLGWGSSLRSLNPLGEAGRPWCLSAWRQKDWAALPWGKTLCSLSYQKLGPPITLVPPHPPHTLPSAPAFLSLSPGLSREERPLDISQPWVPR